MARSRKASTPTTSDDLARHIWHLLKRHGCESFIFAFKDPDSDNDYGCHTGSANWVKGAGVSFTQLPCGAISTISPGEEPH